MAPETKRILIVDDNPEDREYIRRYLQQDPGANYVFAEEHTVAGGLRAMSGSLPDCIMLDYSMPDGNGLRFLERLIEREEARGVGVIMLTGTGDELVAVQAMKSGAHDYLIKGRTNAESLRAAVRNAIYKARTEEVLRGQKAELERLYQETKDSNARKDQLLRELQKAKEVAENANRAKDRFLATLSHELRTPLTPVLSTVTALLDEGVLSEELRRAFEMIRRNVGLEARLIDDLLDLTRIARGKLALDLRPLDLHACITDAVEICRADCEAKNIRVQMELRAERTTVLGDAARLHQVFWNLLKNAVKFTPNDGAVTIRTTNDEMGRISVSVTDTGVGIAPENLPTIFHAFDQGNNQMAKRLGGLGLGLAISKALVDAHGGTVEAASAGAHQGATFTLRLALASAEVPRPAAPGSNGDAPCGPEHPCRVLLVEDHEDSAQALARALRRRHYEVGLAGSVQQAIREYLSQTYDLVICDIGLPDGTGLDVMERIKKEGPVRAIALSGFGMEHDLRRSLEAGFAAHLTKPVDLQRLLGVMGEVLAAGTAPANV